MDSSPDVYPIFYLHLNTGLKRNQIRHEVNMASILGSGVHAPYISLPEAVSVLEECYDKSGDEFSLDLFSAAIKNSTSSSSFAKKLAACRNYGLVNIEGNTISLTVFSQRIFRPRSSKERKATLKEAFLSVDYFRRVYERFLGKILPQEEYLANTFSDFVPKDAAPRWAKRFMESALYAGLILERADGKLQVLDSAETGKDKPVAHVEGGPDEIKEEFLAGKPQPTTGVQQTHLQMLIELLDAKEMGDTEQAAVWTLIQYVKRREAGLPLKGIE